MNSRDLELAAAQTGTVRCQLSHLTRPWQRGFKSLHEHIMLDVKKQTGGRSLSPGILLFLLLVAMPIAEVATFIQVGGWIGLWPTILCVIATAMIGTVIIRHQGIGLLQRVQSQMGQGVLPAFELFSGVCLLIAGALLLTPGFITDGLGFLLLSPPARKGIFAYASRHVRHVRSVKPDGARGPEPPPDDIIDVDFEEIPEDMPPPGRGWGKPKR